MSSAHSSQRPCLAIGGHPPCAKNELVFQDNNNACDGGHIASEAVVTEQRFEASDRGALQLAFHLRRGSTGILLIGFVFTGSSSRG